MDVTNSQYWYLLQVPLRNISLGLAFLKIKLTCLQVSAITAQSFAPILGLLVVTETSGLSFCHFMITIKQLTQDRMKMKNGKLIVKLGY